MFLTERAVAALLDSIPSLMLCINAQLITHPISGPRFRTFLKNMVVLRTKQNSIRVHVNDFSLQGQMTDKGLLSNILFIASHTDTYSLCKNSNKQVAS